MKTVKLSVFAIGVAFSAAPIFNSAVAQERTGQASVMIELQTLRTEIADLRDMVERQQFEMQKLKRSIAKQSQALSQPNDSGGATQPQGNPSQFQPTSRPYMETGSSGEPLSPNGASYRETPYQEIPDQGTNQRLPSTNQGASPVGDDGYRYSSAERQYQPGSEARATDHQYSSSRSGPEVSEREITAPPFDAVGGNRTSNTGPEIIERGVSGVSATNKAPVLSQNSNTSIHNQAAADIALAGVPVTSTINNTAQNAVIGGGAVKPFNPSSSEGNSGFQRQPEISDVDTAMVANTTSIVSVPNGSGTLQRDALGNQAIASPEGQGAINPVIASPAKFSEDEFYDRGFGLLKESKYDEAVSVFKEQIAQHPGGDLTDDAHYWIAEAMFINRKPAEARPHLKAIIDDFPQSARVPDAMLKSAYIEQEMGNLIEARILFQEIVGRHPSSNAAIAAKNRLASLRTN